ncbi:DUF3152 domain-containing protein [Nocardioides marmoriginsengisoli]|uniref:DUF3152 domain-containing protein n=1 Tax=Nocardioides marmoriginsengisoli TaxID=661483 RepID=A0A3N0CLD8_9ACTN|nr:DUF3152 domain-containing protein [Nocardioides marmoriginsengisoli]RNL63723.1 DUF3152 domain-containing protein [Nocardioides marmoriginsengisoli]
MTRKSWVVLATVLIVGLSGLMTAAGAAEPVPPVNQSLPTISGTAKVGQALAAAPGSWLPAAESYAYSWWRDGTAIAGAAGSSYRLVEGDLARRISVRVVATGTDGGVSAPATSLPTAAVQAGVLVAKAAPTISGVRRWGRTLTAAPGTWSPRPTALAYRWLRDGRPIKGAVHPTYRLVVADFGARIKVRVVARRAAYANGTATSPATGLIDHRVGVKRRYTYSIATRGRITANLETFTRLAAASYADPRGWRSAGYQFRQVARGGDFTLVLSSAAKVPSFGAPCSSTWSCRVGRYVIINQTRWQHASPAWNAAGRPLRDYRHMVLNHETGHWLGHWHSSCPGKGRLAPIMMQQSKGLNGCRFNPFPLPSERWTSR